MEDKEVIVEQIQTQLAEQGFYVIKASSADECVRFAEHGCGVFILDLDLGGDREAEGMDALRRLKTIDGKTFCIVLTNHQTDHFRNEATALGCDAFLGKSSRELENSDHILLALDRMILGKVTNLSLSPQSRPSIDEIYAQIANVYNSLLTGEKNRGEIKKLTDLIHRADDPATNKLSMKVSLLQAELESRRPDLRLYRIGAGGLFGSLMSLLTWGLTGVAVPFQQTFAAGFSVVCAGVIVMAFWIRKTSDE